MGCDYYIDKNLIIHFNDGDTEYILIERFRGYWYDPPYDEDEIDYKQKADAWYNKHLTTDAPILIYENNRFLNPSCETKYVYMIQSKLDKCNKNICDIIKIEKNSYGYKRD